MCSFSSHLAQVNYMAAAGGTANRRAFAATMFHFPDMVAVRALPESGGNAEGSAFDMQ